jgi:nitrogenase molybdenum-iron protein alpha/beta subunit
MTETDAVFGTHTDGIGQAVAGLLEVLEPTPRAFMIFFNCVDALSGTDTEAVMEDLRASFSPVEFVGVMAAPINLDEFRSPGERFHAKLYELLRQPSTRDGGVNLIGHYVPLDPACELFRVLEHCGVSEVRELFALTTFAEYRRMERSRLNIALTPMGLHAAQDLEERLGTPFVFSPVSYDIAEALREYGDIASALDAPTLDLSDAVEQTRTAVERARRRLGGRRVVVSGTNSRRPFSLAEALLDNGFNVSAVAASRIEPDQKEARDRVTRRHPALEWWADAGAEARLGPGALPLYKDEGHHGLHGIRRLMDLLGAEAAS